MTAREFSALVVQQNPELFKVCIQCDSIAYEASRVCPQCGAYRWRTSEHAVTAAALLLGKTLSAVDQVISPRIYEANQTF